MSTQSGRTNRGRDGGRGRGPSPGGGRGPSPGRGGPQVTSIHQQTGLPHGFVPAYLPGSSSLVEELDSKCMIVLRDGKHLIGTLTSYDQFSNFSLQDAIERRTVMIDDVCYYTDIPLGLYMVRGDSMVLLGQVHDTDTDMMKQVSLAEFEELQTKQSSDADTVEWDVDNDLVA